MHCIANATNYNFYFHFYITSYFLWEWDWGIGPCGITRIEKNRWLVSRIYIRYRLLPCWNNIRLEFRMYLHIILYYTTCHSCRIGFVRKSKDRALFLKYWKKRNLKAAICIVLIVCLILYYFNCCDVRKPKTSVKPSQPVTIHTLDRILLYWFNCCNMRKPKTPVNAETQEPNLEEEITQLWMRSPIAIWLLGQVRRQIEQSILYKNEFFNQIRPPLIVDFDCIAHKLCDITYKMPTFLNRMSRIIVSNYFTIKKADESVSN